MSLATHGRESGTRRSGRSPRPADANVAGGVASEPPPPRPPIDRGLTEAEAATRRGRYGANAIETHKRSIVGRILGFFWGPIPWMIEIAGGLSAFARHWEDLTIILLMLLINAVVGFWEEFKADTAIEALKQRLAPKARVRRNGTWNEVDAAEIVPGDVVLVRLGNIVPADLELAGDGYLSVDQSALTGESLPVTRKAGESAYSGSVVKTGEMVGYVTAIGSATYFGRTAKLVESATTRSHFQRAVLKIGNFLIFTTLALVAVIVLVALFRHEPLIDTLMFALILTVAAIPVALPAVLSVTMAVGANHLAAMKAIVSRLVSIEELAGMDILCSDKTGTLTKNELSLGDPVLAGAKDGGELVLWAALASRADDGDIIDTVVRKAVLDPSALAGFTTERFQPFDPVHKRTEATVAREGQHTVVSKGAPQVILALAAPDDRTRRAMEEAVDKLGAAGYRTLGVARRPQSGPWQFLGLLSLFDPPRDDASATIAEARGMGLQIKMVTGDHAAIARETARKLGLGEEVVSAKAIFDADGKAKGIAEIEGINAFAEVFPEHKFAIVKELQARGHIVGMTGDGVNDAPALKQADVGIAVSGATDAARAAADLVLTAPGLSVIARAVEESRRIFERMTSYSIFRIAETVRVLLFMSLSILVFGFYPVTAVMIVLLAILNDFPIMMIAYDNVPVAPAPVRWDMGRVLTLSSILGVLGVIASFAFFWIVRSYFGLDDDTVRTLIFLKLLVAGHMTIYITRNTGPLWQRPLPGWRLVAAAEATQVLGTLAAVYGWFVAPIGWSKALLVWAYALAWLGINSVVKIGALRFLKQGTKLHARHLMRVGSSLHTP
jgi:H+-transporting ATPase